MSKVPTVGKITLSMYTALLIFAFCSSDADSFGKTVIDRRFVAEGVAVGDVNRDGKLDILAGNVWYAAPGWTPHEIAPAVTVDPKREYSNCFNTWAVDLNRDGWIDQIVIGMPGEKAIWRENPRGENRAWKEHPIWRSAGNESPLYADLFGNGRKVLVMGYDDAHLAWFEPAKDPNAEWICHDISELGGAGSQRYSHGLGLGDLNGDKQSEILTPTGYYTFAEGKWSFMKADLGPDCAQMLVFDVDKDRRADVLSTSAHDRGVWWFQKLATGDFQRHVLDRTISESHSANLLRMGKAKALNVVTGKRKWAHPPGVDPGSEEPAWLVRYEWKGNLWERHVIDEDSGVGTQFVVQDVNKDRLDDIVVSNKNGVFLFTQQHVN